MRRLAAGLAPGLVMERRRPGVSWGGSESDPGPDGVASGFDNPAERDLLRATLLLAGPSSVFLTLIPNSSVHLVSSASSRQGLRKRTPAEPP